MRKLFETKKGHKLFFSDKFASIVVSNQDSLNAILLALQEDLKSPIIYDRIMASAILSALNTNPIKTFAQL